MRLALCILVTACASAAPNPILPPDDSDPEIERQGYLPPDFEDLPRHVEREGEPTAAGEPLFATSRGSIVDVRFSPRGESVAVTTRDKVVAILDARDGSLRAARRVRVRADESIRLVGFDATGTRLLFVTYGYSSSNVYAWDLWSHRFLVVEQLEAEGFGRVAFGGDSLVYAAFEEQTVRVVRTTESTSVDIGAEVERMISAADYNTVLLETSEGVSFLDTGTATVRAQVEGTVNSVRPGGGLIAITQPNGTRLVDESGASRAFLSDRVASFTSEGELVIDGRRDGVLTRTVLNPRTEEVLAQGSLTVDVRQHRDRGRVSFATEDENRVLARYDLLGGERTVLLEAWADGEAPYDEDSGLEYSLGAVDVSPDGQSLAVAIANQVRILDATSGDERGRYESDTGESSVWGVETYPSGIAIWGRGWAQHWGARGLRQVRCPGGEGTLVLSEDQIGMVSPYQACLGEQVHRSDDDEVRHLIGVHGQRFIEWNDDQLLHRDLQTGRVRATWRGPAGMEIYCEGSCSARYFPLNPRAAVLFDSMNGEAWLVGSGRPRKLAEGIRWGSRAVGDRFVAVQDDTAVLYDARGRTVSDQPGALVAINEEGTEWVSYTPGSDLIVVDVNTHRERARIESSDEPVSMQLFGEAVVVQTERETIVHNTRGADPLRLSRSNALGVFPDGSHLVVCEAGTLTVRRINGEVRSELGDCGLGEQVFLWNAAAATDGTLSGFVTLDSVTVVEVFKLAGGPPLTIRTNGGVPVAYSGDHYWTPDDSIDAFRWRESGAVTTAAVSAGRPHYDSGLLARFFGAP